MRWVRGATLTVRETMWWRRDAAPSLVNMIRFTATVIVLSVLVNIDPSTRGGAQGSVVRRWGEQLGTSVRELRQFVYDAKRSRVYVSGLNAVYALSASLEEIDTLTTGPKDDRLVILIHLGQD